MSNDSTPATTPGGPATFRVGIVGVSGYGGGEALRLCAGHQNFEVSYVAGESSAGKRVGELYPGLGNLKSQISDLQIRSFDPAALPPLDVLFASLPTGASRGPLAAVPASVRVVDIGGDHRYVEGWAYGLADVWPEAVRGKDRVANPGCFPAATLAAVAPLLAAGLVDGSAGVVVDAKTGISGAGRGGAASSAFGFSEVNESTAAYRLTGHAHVPEIEQSMALLAARAPGSPDAAARSAGGRSDGAPPPVPLTFVPHLVPMTRGILATCYLTATDATVTAERCLAAARDFYAGRPFVRVCETPPPTKWATGSNLAFVHYAADPSRRRVIAVGAIDNLGKGAAGQAVQNANLMLGLPETAGLTGAPLWP